MFQTQGFMRKAALLPLCLMLGGCLTDSTTANNRSVLPPPNAKIPTTTDDGSPKQLCESTMEGNDAKTVCY